MIKNNKLKIFISSAVILLPIIAGFIMWDMLPEKLATHWGVGGEANGWSSKGFAVFGFPLLVFVIHWLCILVSNFDKKNEHQNPKLFRIVFWICPAVSVLGAAAIYTAALGINFSIDRISLALMGLMFIIVGNYLPKCKQNRTLGIKVKWTLENEENWNATHRFGGKVWAAGGIIFIIGAFLPSTIISYILLGLIFALAIIPVIYSYIYYKKQIEK